ncbi:complement receptor type 2 [Parus major]|uniref:complement receptor type 2 n=1 Tax=Parus major TaxID=9157 RepID=UPI001444768A|nr:complement receptor type 2 [Parus major]
MGSGCCCSLLPLLLLLVLPVVWGDCGPLPNISHAEPQGDTKEQQSFSVGSTVTFSCVPGYTKRPFLSDTIQCLTNSRWSSLPEFCGRSCPRPPSVKFALLSPQDQRQNFYAVNTTVRYICHPSHDNTTDQPPTSTCLDNLTWTEVPELCQKKSCGIPADPEHGQVMAKDHQLGATANVVCDRGYRLEGASPSIKCLLQEGKAVWSPLPACQVISCPPPPSIAHGQHSGNSSQEFVFGSITTYTCEPGLELVGQDTLRCTTDSGDSGTWSGAPPTCRVKTTAETNQTKTSEENPYWLASILIPSCIVPPVVLGLLAGVIMSRKESEKHSYNVNLQKREMKGRDAAMHLEVTDEKKQPKPWNSYFCTMNTLLSRGCFTGGFGFCWLLSGWISPVSLIHSHAGNCHVCPSCEEQLHSDLAPLSEPTRPGCTVCQDWLSSQPQKPRTYSVPSIGDGDRQSPAGTSSPAKAGDVLRGNGTEEAALWWSEAEQPRDHQSEHICPICESWLRAHTGQGGSRAVTPGDWQDERCAHLARPRVLWSSAFKNPAVGASFHPLPCAFPSCACGSFACGEEVLGQSSDKPTAPSLPSLHGLAAAVPCPRGHSQQPRVSPGRGGHPEPPGPCAEPRLPRLSRVLGAQPRSPVQPPHLAAAAALCPSPRVRHGTVSPRRYSYRTWDTVTFTCSPGYALRGSRSSTCGAGSRWNPPPPECRKELSCPRPPSIANGLHSGHSWASFPRGVTVSYSCSEGFQLLGNASITCTDSGLWSRPLPRCEAIGCQVPEVQNGNVHNPQSTYRAGETLLFDCDAGYSSEDTAEARCQPGGTWDPPLLVCQRGKQCSHPGEPVNGKIISLTDLQIGSTVVYSCEEGSNPSTTRHRLIGQSSRSCQISGGRVAWSGDVPLCQRIPCEPPPDIPNGKHSGRLLSEFLYGTSVTYSCDPGFPLHGEPSIHCTTRDGSSGMWSEPLPACGVASCPVPRIQNGRIVAPRSAYAHRDTVTFECDPGYAIRGHRELQCQPNNTWEPPVPVCEPAGCRAPARLEFAQLKEPYGKQEVFPEGSRVEYVCQPGYTQLPGVSPAITCLGNQTWSAALQFCQRQQCPSPGDPENGRAVVLTDLLLGSRINYTCDKGYKLVGGSQRICEVSGTGVSWSGDPPVCQRITCAPPPSIPHGTHSGGSRDTFSFGDVVTYTCSSGLALVGDASLSCSSADGQRGSWSGAVPRCQEKPGCFSLMEKRAKESFWKSDISPCPDGLHLCCLPPLLSEGWVFGGFPALSLFLTLLLLSLAEVRCPAPPSIANGQHSGSPGARHSPGSEVLYTCAEGYSLLGNASIRCTARGTWSRPQPRCQATGCTKPEIENGKATGLETTYKLKDIIFFECNFGYALKGSQESQCQFGGKWHPPVPTCEKLLPCPPPPIIRNGQHDSKGVTEFIPGTSVKYNCEPGYALTGKTTVSCLPSGVWSIPYPRCEVITCSSPSIKNGEVAEGRRAVYHPGDNVTFQCQPGFVLRGSRGAKCHPDSRWVPAVPTCQPAADCGTPPPLLFAELSEEYENQTVFPVGMTVNYTCRPGYMEQPQISPTITCLENLTWSEAQEFCKVLQCPSPPNIDKGKHNSQDVEVFPSGMVVNYSCDPGYSLQGQASIYCTDSGNWSLPLPQCAGGCGAPPNLTFAELTREYRNQLEFAVGDTVRYSCRPGHSRRPGVPQTLTCLQNLTWSEALEFCKRKQCKQPESPRHGRVVVLTDLLFGSTVSHTCDQGWPRAGAESGSKPMTQGGSSPLEISWVLIYHLNNLTQSFWGQCCSSWLSLCTSRYRLVGQSHRRCEILGRDVVWTGLPPTCQRVVCPAPQIQNGRVAVPKPRYTYRDSVTFKCHRGFTLRGHPTSQCQGDRRWHPPVPVCERDGAAAPYHQPGTTTKPVLHCSKPADITHGSFHGPAKAVFTPGTSVNYTCEPGFSLLGTASIYCTASGAWSHPPPVCQAGKCLQPPNITNGRLKGNTSATFPSGASVFYSCNPGYSLLGNASITCTVSGAWSQPLPQCQEIRCEFPDVHGVKKAIKGNTYRSGTNITLECDEGYVLEGISHTQCQEDFSWDPPVPACKLTSSQSRSVGLGVAAAAVLLLLGAGVVWKIISKQKEGYYRTYENYNYRTPLNPSTEHKDLCLP